MTYALNSTQGPLDLANDLGPTAWLDDAKTHK